MEELLYSLYIFASVFGLGVTTIDMLGLVGDDDEGDIDVDGGESEGVEDDGVEGDGDGAEGDQGDSDGEGDDGPEESSALAHGNQTTEKRAVGFLSRMVASLRLFIYFSMGFGPAGLAALISGNSLLNSLLWAAGTGVVSSLGAYLIRRMMRKELSSDVKDYELLMEEAEVIVSIAPGQMGKVRARVGGSYVERYARCEDESVSLKVGDRVEIVRSESDCIYVRGI